MANFCHRNAMANFCHGKFAMAIPWQKFAMAIQWQKFAMASPWQLQKSLPWQNIINKKNNIFSLNFFFKSLNCYPKENIVNFCKMF
jgi:hypothetical protein